MDGAREPEGYVLAPTGLLHIRNHILRDSQEAQEWSDRLQRPMHSASIETDRFSIALVFSEIRHLKISEDTGVVRQSVSTC